MRKTAELILIDMVQLLFARLPQFKEDLRMASLKKVKNLKLFNHLNSYLKFQLTMKGSSYDSSKQKRKKVKPQTSNQVLNAAIKSPSLTNTTTEPAANLITSSQSSLNTNLDLITKQQSDQPVEPIDSNNNTNVVAGDAENQTVLAAEDVLISAANIIDVGSNDLTQNINDTKNDDTISQSSISTIDAQPQAQLQTDVDYVNPRGVRFVQDGTNSSPAVPYGLPCVRELLRFLISLINS